MEHQSLVDSLVDLEIKAIRYFDSIGSTNDEAVRWAEAGALDMSLVFADEQTSGRGRAGRQWFTPAGSALALSLILRFPGPDQSGGRLARLSGLGALAVSDALLEYRLPAQVKWPNDVLVRRRKVAGVLVEACWEGGQLTAAVLGIGVNAAPQAVPPAYELIYPATCVEAEAGFKIERLELLHAILFHMLKRKESLFTDQFLQDWNNRLAFRGEWVQILEHGKIMEGQVMGLNEDGSLLLNTRSGQIISIYAGDLRLRPNE
jgi:BirA family transcriptional regulator, biotin operon repressor / biotin---[acetyl-CoA-carboxylase] ligase